NPGQVNVSVSCYAVFMLLSCLPAALDRVPLPSAQRLLLPAALAPPSVSHLLRPPSCPASLGISTADSVPTPAAPTAALPDCSPLATLPALLPHSTDTT